MSKEYVVTITALIRVSDKSELEDLVICRRDEDRFGIETFIAEDENFEIIDYMDTEITEIKN
jgi:hypothetical protein